MSHQHACISRDSTTSIADMLPFLGMDDFMHLQVASPSQLFTTVHAEMNLLSTMDQFMFNQGASLSGGWTT